MSILKVARMGHPVLRQRARELDPTEVRTPAFQKLIDDMLETMAEYEGIGLAAPQVHESVRLFIAGISGSGANLKVLPFINPVITPLDEEQMEDWEGCLSIPGISGKVRRAKEVSIKALDRRGKPFELVLKNYPARVVQHETDHLDGILYFDRMSSLETLTFNEERQKYLTPEQDED